MTSASEDDALYLGHILEAVEKIEAYTAPGHAEFMDSTLRQDAVIRQLQVLGEAVKRLSAEAKANRPEVPWRRIAGMRDVVVHDYAGIDLEAVWEVSQEKLEQVRLAVEALSSPEG